VPPRPSRASGLALLLGGLLALAPAPPAQAQPGWVLPASLLTAPVSPPTYFGQPAVESDALGDATVLFAEEDGGVKQLFYEDHQPGGQWSAPVALPTGERPEWPAIAISPQGDATAAWLDRSGPSSPVRVWVSERPAGGSWSAPLALEQSGEASDVVEAGPVLAEDEAGDAVVAWVEASSGYTPQWVVGAYRYDGSWSSPARISEPARYVDGSWGPSTLLANAAGDFVLVWDQEDEASTSSVEAEELQDGAFTGEQTIESTPDRLNGAAAGENAAGEASAIWADESTGQAHAASFRGGAWSLADPPGANIRTICYQGPPKIAVDGSGSSLALWLEESGQLVSAWMSPGGAWGAHEPVTTLGGFVNNLELAVDPAGDALADWTNAEYDSALSRFQFRVQAASRLAAAAWSQPVALAGEPGEDGSSAYLSMDPKGNGVSAFSQTEGAGSTVLAAGFEMAPLIRSVTVPGELAPAAAGSFAADAVAPWASVASEQWLFGDGASAQGASVAHAYAKPGVYTVTLTVTDSLGNTTSATRQITVSQATAAPGTQAASPPATPTRAAPRVQLGPVYLIVSKQRFWLPAHGRVVRARIRNTNPFPVSGTATMTAHFLAPGGRGAAASLKPVATVTHFSLPAKGTGVVRFRISAAALHRLHANVPDRGHNLVSVHLAIHGGGSSASSLGVYVLDQRVPPRRGPRPHAGPGYRAPADPWAHSSC